jgi:UTP--glucose-1-phosphate uridylyltransferase
MAKIRKAVIPAAGYGTRFLPMTKASPKEMIPVIDKPVIQYVVEELVDADIKQIILVTGWHKRAIEDHFDRHLELEHKLEESGKSEALKKIKSLSEMAEFFYVRQKELNGNGGAILTAKNIVGNEPFIVLWGDDFILAEPSRTKQLIAAFEKYQTPIMGAIRRTDDEAARRYAFAKGEEVEEGVIKISEMIEKPGSENRPSDLAIVSGYVYTPDIFEALESVKLEPGKELVYVDGINVLREKGKDVYAVEIKGGRYYDCGNVNDYLKTNIEMALKREDIGPGLKEYLKNLDI